jgi:hypothetical protein
MTQLQPRPRVFAWCTEDGRGRGWRISSCVSRPVVVKNHCCGHYCEKADALVWTSLSGFETGDRQALSNQSLYKVCWADGVSLVRKC